MTDYIHQTLKFISYNRYTFGGILLGVGVVTLTACSQFDGKYNDPISGKEMSQPQLAIAYNKALDSAQKKWDEGFRLMDEAEKDAANLGQDFDIAMAAAAQEKQNLKELGGFVTELALSNPVTASLAPWITAGVTIAGIGVVADNRRKGGIIKSQKAS